MPLFGKKTSEADEQAALDTDEPTRPARPRNDVPLNEEEALVNQHFETGGVPTLDTEDLTSLADDVPGGTGTSPGGQSQAGQEPAGGDAGIGKDALDDDLMAIFDSEVVEDDSLKALTGDLEDVDLNSLLTQGRHLSSRLGGGGTAP